MYECIYIHSTDEWCVSHHHRFFVWMNGVVYECIRLVIEDSLSSWYVHYLNYTNSQVLRDIAFGAHEILLADSHIHITNSISHLNITNSQVPRIIAFGAHAILFADSRVPISHLILQTLGYTVTLRLGCTLFYSLIHMYQ